MKLLLLCLLLSSCATTRLYYPSGKLAAVVQGDVHGFKMEGISADRINHSNTNNDYTQLVSALGGLTWLTVVFK